MKCHFTAAGLVLACALGAAAAHPITEFALPHAGSQPYGIAKGPDGKMWFTESKGQRIGRISMAGTIEEFALPHGGDPIAIAAGPDGNMWFVENRAARIGRIDSSGTIKEFPLRAGAKPVDITAGPDGALWFTEEADKIGRIETSGTVTEIALQGPDCAPDGIAADTKAIWFTESGCDTIDRMDPHSHHITRVKEPYGSAPAAIAPGMHGDMWFSENANIGRIESAGKVVTFPLHGVLGIPPSIALGPDGNMWFPEPSSGAPGELDGIGRIDGAGKVVTFSAGLSPNAFPLGIAVGADGNLWFTQYNANKIGTLHLR